MSEENKEVVNQDTENQENVNQENSKIVYVEKCTSTPGKAVGIPAFIIGVIAFFIKINALSMPLYISMYSSYLKQKYTSSTTRVIIDTSVADAIYEFCSKAAPILAGIAIVLGIVAIIWCAASKAKAKKQTGLVMGIIGIVLSILTFAASAIPSEIFEMFA